VLKKNKIAVLTAGLFLALPFTVSADILVDGGYDWNLDFSDSTNSVSYVYAQGVKEGAADADFATNGLANHSKTSGASGGAIYDAEKMFLQIKDNTLYVAIVTGLSPSNAYSAGDILFDLNGDMTDSANQMITADNFSLTDTAGANKAISPAGDSNGYEFGITVADHGNQDVISGSKYFDYGNAASAGDLFSLTQWNSGTDYKYALNPASGRNGILQSGSTSMLYGAGSGIAASSFVIETAISLVDSSGNRNLFGQSLLDSVADGSTSNINVHWNPLCNNDWIQYTGSLSYNTSVPEPAPLALMAIGLAGFLRRKKRQQK